MQLNIQMMAVPERLECIQPTLRELGGELAEINIDYEGHGPWATARRAWKAGVESDCTHVLVMHDDMVLSWDFMDNVYAAIEAHPQNALSFFHSAKRGEHHNRGNGWHWLAFQTFGWGGATVLPREIAEHFIFWADACIDPEWKADDTRLLLYLACTGRRLYCSTPSLVQHNPALRSAHMPDRLNVDMQAGQFHRGGLLAWNGPVKYVDGDVRSLVVSRKKHFIQFPEVVPWAEHPSLSDQILSSVSSR